MSEFIDSRREHFGVEPICATLGVSASAYYQRGTWERSQRRGGDERPLELIRGMHRENYECYGEDRIWRELKRRGVDVGRDRA